jgi:excinuclease ABC subunit B
MRAAAADLEFETAARLRDEIRRLEAMDLGVPDPGRQLEKAASRARRPAATGRPKGRRRGR